MPTPRSVSDIKSKLLQPALTSHFEVFITKPPGLEDNRYLEENNIPFNADTQDQLNLLCSEASLPGSNLATLEINNDYTGVTERHAYRRIYDDRIDLTFYVDANNYLPIKFFETWMKYIVGENINDPKRNENLPLGSKNPNYFYRVRYPELYISEQGLKVVKFERTNVNNKPGVYNSSTLEYQFVNCFPISLSSMPVSYDTSSLLKCTVSMSYIRYYVIGTKDANQPSEATTNPGLTPDQQARLNELRFDPNGFNSNLGLDYARYTTTGGVSFPATLSSGNRIASRSSQLNTVRSMQEASRLRQSGFSPGLGGSGAAGPGFG